MNLLQRFYQLKSNLVSSEQWNILSSNLKSQHLHDIFEREYYHNGGELAHLFEKLMLKQGFKNYPFDIDNIIYDELIKIFDLFERTIKLQILK